MMWLLEGIRCCYVHILRENIWNPLRLGVGKGNMNLKTFAFVAYFARQKG